MKGVSSVIETVLIAAATLLFLVYLVEALNSFSDRVVNERTRVAMSIDSQKIINAILLARREIGSGQAKFYVSLSEINYEMFIQGGNLIARNRNHLTNTSLFNMDSYLTFSGKIVNSKNQKPYVISSGNQITLGVE